jgi:hypothetical protein
MFAPHSSSALMRIEDTEPTAKATDNEIGLYLVTPTSADTSAAGSKIEWLEEKMRQANYEIARLQSLLLHKEQLLQNFRVRERELKVAFFQGNPGGRVPQDNKT